MPRHLPPTDVSHDLSRSSPISIRWPVADQRQTKQKKKKKKKMKSNKGRTFQLPTHHRPRGSAAAPWRLESEPWRQRHLWAPWTTTYLMFLSNHELSHQDRIGIRVRRKKIRAKNLRLDERSHDTASFPEQICSTLIGRFCCRSAQILNRFKLYGECTL